MVLSGASTTAQLRSNLASAEVPRAARWAAALPEELAALAEPRHTYWDIRRSLPWN